jgi:hypothetical protein
MADHTRQDVDTLVRLMHQSMKSAELEYRELREASKALGRAETASEPTSDRAAA